MIIKYPVTKFEIEQVEVEELPNVGWIRITEIGEENMYWQDENGKRFFCKVAG